MVGGEGFLLVLASRLPVLQGFFAELEEGLAVSFRVLFPMTGVGLYSTTWFWAKAFLVGGLGEVVRMGYALIGVRIHSFIHTPRACLRLCVAGRFPLRRGALGLCISVTRLC